jgi:PAS domain S-box-containing protein
MDRRLRILHLEDEPDYSALVGSLFEKDGVPVDLVLVCNRADFEAALQTPPFDVILADYMLPGYDGISALHTAREKCPEVPFLLVSGTIGEQAAIESLKAGATDYVLKLWPERLVPAVHRAAYEAQERAKRHRAETQLVQRELVLRESEAHYRLIFDGNPTPMWVFDTETLAFLEVNDAAVRTYGYSREEFLAMTLRDIRPDSDVPALIEYVHKLTSGATPVRVGMAGVWRHRKKDGTLLDAEIKWSPITFRGRCASLGMATDVTERRRNEHRDAALSQLGQRLSSATSPIEAARIIKTVADDLFSLDAFTLDLYVQETDQVNPILNVDTDRSGKRFDIPVTELARTPSQMARRIIERGAELILREEPVTLPGDSVPIGDTSRPSASLLLVPIRNRTKVIGILSIQSYQLRAYGTQDLATLQTLADHCGGALERIRAEQALHESEQRFRDLFEGSPDAIFVEDFDGTVLDVNPVGCRLHSMSRDELVGRKVTELVPPDLRDEVQESFQALVDGTLQQVEGASWTRDGRAVPVEVRVNRISYAGRKAVLLHVSDISQRKQSEAALRRLEEELRQSQKMEAIGQLAGGVAHDFNNILTVIHGHGSLLKANASLDATGGRSAHQIIQAAERAASLTRQLLAFSRRQVIQSRKLDLNEVVTNMTRMLGRILGEDIAVQLHYSPRPALVLADASMMEQVVLNLAVNARDAMRQGGLLTIRVSAIEFKQGDPEHADRRHGQFVCLTVTDTGCGIPAENLPRIFEPFFTTKEVGKGTGLGLATVYGIVRQHQGWIEVTSQPGKGATFKVFVPATDGSAETGEASASRNAIRGGSETILVVEDETPVRELVCDFLTSCGYKILQAESGLKALELWPQHKDQVDLVLTDLVMPDRINGRELAEKLWLERPHLKVIFTSGYSADVVGKDFVSRTGLSYLQKPYHPHELALAVRDCLDAVN